MDEYRALKDAARQILIESNTPVEQLDEVNGFDTDRSVTIAHENVGRILATFTPSGSLKKVVERELGAAETTKAFKEMAQHLSKFATIWTKVSSAASKQYDKDLMGEDFDSVDEETEDLNEGHIAHDKNVAGAMAAWKALGLYFRPGQPMKKTFADIVGLNATSKAWNKIVTRLADSSSEFSILFQAAAEKQDALDEELSEGGGFSDMFMDILKANTPQVNAGFTKLGMNARAELSKATFGISDNKEFRAITKNAYVYLLTPSVVKKHGFDKSKNTEIVKGSEGENIVIVAR
jgi:hypothetical protein